jgi:HSP20 family protein
MALIRWEPIGEFHTIQNEMNRLFNTLSDQPEQAAHGGAMMRRWIPAMDLVESGETYILRADLPGLSEDDVKIELEGNVLTVSGDRKGEHEDHEQGYYRVERAFGAFSRSLTLPDGVNPDAVKAHFDRGVLEVQIPKPEQRKPRKVSIATHAGAAEAKKVESVGMPASSGANVADPATANV